MGMERWLILADDLTGAADTAIAFARRGWTASVTWRDAVAAGTAADGILAIDCGTRYSAPPAAAARQAALLRAHGADRPGLYKKIDSTLRGQPAAELAALLEMRDAVALVAPAFPAQGRTTLGGRVQLHGLALETTPLWAREHSYPAADLRLIFGRDGAPARHATLESLHDGSLPALLEEALADRPCALVCDAEEDRDLALIVQAAAPFARRLIWVGSAGLAQAIAFAEPPHGAPPSLPRVDGGILVVVGSMAEASRAGLAPLMEDPELRPVTVTPAMLRAGPAAWEGTRHSVQASLARGEDILVSLSGAGGIDPALTRELAALLRGATLGGLIATGGETALALLEAFGASALRMVAEVETGAPLGLAGSLTVITKAGAFGDAGTLARCLAFMRGLRATERHP